MFDIGDLRDIHRQQRSELGRSPGSDAIRVELEGHHGDALPTTRDIAYFLRDDGVIFKCSREMSILLDSIDGFRTASELRRLEDITKNIASIEFLIFHLYNLRLVVPSRAFPRDRARSAMSVRSGAGGA
jgi:hypothetical protein